MGKSKHECLDFQLIKEGKDTVVVECMDCSKVYNEFSRDDWENMDKLDDI